MSTSKYVLTGFLAIALSAVAQQEKDIPAQAPAPDAAATTVVTPAPAQPQAATPAPAAVPTTPVTTMDDVVNRAIAREHALMDMLKTRNPLVETYLQMTGRAGNRQVRDASVALLHGDGGVLSSHVSMFLERTR